jgi:hypothetical protein
MPYYPKQEELRYKCPGCGKTFQTTGMNCLVAHSPGTCCHITEYEVSPYDPEAVKKSLDKLKASR